MRWREREKGGDNHSWVWNRERLIAQKILNGNGKEDEKAKKKEGEKETERDKRHTKITTEWMNDRKKNG